MDIINDWGSLKVIYTELDELITTKYISSFEIVDTIDDKYYIIANTFVMDVTGQQIIYQLTEPYDYDIIKKTMGLLIQTITANDISMVNL